MSTGSKPNLLIIQVDQQSCWSLSSYGGVLVETPNIDRIGREGALFTNFFTNSAVCTPSRGCFLTGRYPHAHGAYHNNIPLHSDEITLANVLQRQGYETGYSGKWHLDGWDIPGWVPPERSFGFEDCRTMYNRGHWKKIVGEPDGEVSVLPYKQMGDAETYSTDWLTQRTIDYIRKPRRRPFFFMVSIPDPHQPYAVRPPYDTMYRPEDMPLPETFSQKDLPSWAAANRERYAYSLDNPDREEALRKNKAAYCGEVKCIDDNVGRILAALEEQEILDNTIVVYTSDHGDYMGEHGLFGKNELYESVYRIPLLVRWPERIKPATVVESIVAIVDFPQTVLGLMGTAPSGREQGRDGTALLTGENVEWVDESFIHHSSFERVGIFTPQFEMAYVRDAEPVLFDRLNDPEQRHNLFGRPELVSVVEELTQRIINHHRDVDSPAISWLERSTQDEEYARGDL